MKFVDLEKLLETALHRLARTLSRGLQPVLVTIAPDLPKVPWEDEFLETLLAEVFHTIVRSGCDQPLRIAICRTESRPELEVVVGVSPTCWIQIEIEGRDASSLEVLWSLEAVLQNKSDIFGYHREERKGLKAGAAQLAVFRASGDSTLRMAVDVRKDGFDWKFAFLIPVVSHDPPADP